MATKVTRNAGWMLDITSGHNIRLGLTLLVVQLVITYVHIYGTSGYMCVILKYFMPQIVVFYFDHNMILNYIITYQIDAKVSMSFKNVINNCVVA